MRTSFIQKIIDFKIKILNSRAIRAFKEKYPNIFKFIYNRFSLEKFSGLPLSVFLLALFSNLLLLLGITNNVLEKDVTSLDGFIGKFFFDIRNRQVAKFFYIITQLCNSYVVISIAALVIIYFLIKEKYLFTLGILISLFGSSITIYLSKMTFGINRPYHYSHYYENSFTYPSGHTTIVVAFYGLLFYIFGQHKSSIKKWSKLISTAFIFFVIIGISRLYLGVHYFSDIIGGYLLGSFWLFLSISFIEWRKYQ